VNKKHTHSVYAIRTWPGTGVYIETCACGAKRKHIYRGQGELNCDETITEWKMPLSKRIAQLLGLKT
jgi:hypothetical protein